MQKVVVYAKNTSDKTFKGTISVTSLDVDGKSLGRDYIYIEGLERGVLPLDVPRKGPEKGHFVPSCEPPFS